MWSAPSPAPTEHLEYGYPRNDAHYTATAEDVARVRRELGVPEGRTAVLYAPTHRDHHTGFRDRPGPGGVLRGGRRGTSPSCCARTTSTTGAAPWARTGSSTSPGTAPPRTCLAADALITDYSSIMFDYANLDRPIVVYADDWDVYRGDPGRLLRPAGPAARAGRPDPAGAGRRLPRRLVRGPAGPGAAGRVPGAVLPVRRRAGRRAGGPAGAARRAAGGGAAGDPARGTHSRPRRRDPREELTRRAPLQCDRALFQGAGLSARVPGLGARPVLRRLRADRRGRLLPGRLRRDPGRVRRAGPARAGAAPAGERGSGPGPQRGPAARHRRLPLLPGQRRHPHPGRAPGDRRPARRGRRPGRARLRLRAHLLVGAAPGATSSRTSWRRPPARSPSRSTRRSSTC